jgi:glutathione S-transferase
MATVEGLSLYHYSGCMWCAMVRRAIEELGIEIAERNIHQDPQHLRDLVAATGRQTVPCLRIEKGGEDRWMHESNDIIAYLSERFAASA